MASFIDIAYPLINKKVKGLIDAKIVASITLTEPIRIVRHYISDIKNSGNDILVTLGIEYETLTNTHLTLSKTVKANTFDYVLNTTQQSSDNLPFYGVITSFITVDKTLFDSQVTLTPTQGTLEPCTLIITPNASASIECSVNGNVVEGELEFDSKISITNMYDNTYNIHGEAPSESISAAQGINSINGITGKDLKLSVSDSFVITNDEVNHRIIISSK